MLASVHQLLQATSESSAGVAAGGRTGLTAVTTAVLFFISLIFAPIFTSIPSFATTPAMLYVGLLMLSSIRQVKFDGDIADAIGALLGNHYDAAYLFNR